MAETEPQINFGNYSFQTATNNGNANNANYAANTATPTDASGAAAGPDQAYQFPPPTDVEMYHDMNPSP
ncbi:hypothetical protein FRC07_006314, partial [Ceratobasidium sp. 392]